MALLHESVHFKRLDTRLVERNVARGVVTPQEWADAVKALPDDNENAEWVSIEDLAEDLTGDLTDSISNGKAPH